MDKTPPPATFAATRALSRGLGKAIEVFVDDGLEVKFSARPTNGPQVPHDRDELYVVASGTARYRVDNGIFAASPGDLLYCAAHVAHGFEDMSDDFTIWVIFYGPRKAAPRS